MVQQQTTNTVTFYQGVPWGGGGVLTLNDNCLIWFSSKQQILPLFIRGFHGGCSPWMILSHGSAANNKYCHFLSGVPWGGAHLEWYCLIWFSSKQQILSLFIRGLHGRCSPWMIIVSYGSAANNKYCHFLSGGSMGGGCSPWMIIVSYGSAANNKYCHFLSGGSMGGAHLEW